MPCYSITSTTIQLGKNTNVEFLAAALTKLGLNPQKNPTRIYFSGGEYNIATGNLTLRVGNADEQGALIKRAYGAQIVLNEAARYGWQVAETAPFEYQITKQ